MAPEPNDDSSDPPSPDPDDLRRPQERTRLERGEDQALPVEEERATPGAPADGSEPGLGPDADDPMAGPAPSG